MKERVIGVAYVDSPEGLEALRTGHELAHRMDATLRVIHVVKSGVGAYAGIAASVPARHGTDVIDVTGELRLAAEHEILWHLAELGDDVPVEVDTFVGDAADTLIAVSENLDLLVCGSRGHGPVRSVLLGSVSQRVTAESHCPVIVLPRGVRMVTPA